MSTGQGQLGTAQNLGSLNTVQKHECAFFKALEGAHYYPRNQWELWLFFVLWLSFPAPALYSSEQVAGGSGPLTGKDVSHKGCRTQRPWITVFLHPILTPTSPQSDRGMASSHRPLGIVNSSRGLHRRQNYISASDHPRGTFPAPGRFWEL